MKLKVPAQDLDALLAEAPMQVVRISQILSKRTSVEGLNWEARLAKRAEEADEDLEELLAYEVDPDGKLRSKISERLRARIQMWRMQHHPEIMKKKNEALAAQVQVNIGADAITAALHAAAEMDRHMLGAPSAALPAPASIIDVEAERKP